MSGRGLNLFQHAMTRWEELHPYNAAHAVRLEGPADVAALQCAIDDACRAAGLGDLRFDASSRRYRFGDYHGAAVERLSPAPDGERGLLRHVRAQMNHRFPPESHSPLRWAVLPDGPHAHWVVLAYQHFVADGHSVVELMSGVLQRYTAAAPPAAPPRLCTDPAGRGASAWGAALRAGHLRAFVRAAILAQRVQRAFHMPDDAAAGYETDVMMRSAPAGLTARLSDAARPCGGGLNDVAMAALASQIHAQFIEPAGATAVRRLAIGTVLSSRPRAAAGESPFEMGVSIHNLAVLLDRADGGMRRVVEAVARQMAPYKRRPHTAAMVSGMRMAWVTRVWPLLGVANSRASYQRIFPLCGGVTSMRIEAERLLAAAGRVTRYVRAAPPGPATPLALAPTVWGDRLELVLVYRLASLDPPAAERLLDGVLERLIDFAGAGRQGPPSGVNTPQHAHAGA